ncbi:iron ABC transporter ATP-binding protein [Bowdeniella nasicola]|uniref:Iron ABC transporter ATP-binding protein n=1 Tax=Bowdeniella nasicola TaxID=208480 RepID=A0A1Q5Q225_9ACTO|nr:iron ABC transporter ATP-binding protein [Bowdeniella nasicola]
MDDTSEEQDGKAQSIAGQRAIKRLMVPVRKKIRIAQLLAFLSGVLSIAPYVALVELGGALLGQFDPDRAWRIVMILIGAYTTRLFLYFLALLATHVVDLDLRSQMRREITNKLARVELSWFTRTSSGQIRKSIQDDTATAHTVIAHGPVEKLNAIVSPVCLLAYAFYLDWRLGLLSIATFPLYLGMYGLSMRGMGEKTAQMDTKLARVSSTMAEFIAGISVVKAFGKVGQAHRAYLEAAGQFSQFYHAWAMPLVSMSCLSFSWVSIPVLLVVNLGGGAALLAAGVVTAEKVIATTLIALVLPGAVMTVAMISWSYQLAGSAAVRLVNMMDLPVLTWPEIGMQPTSFDIRVQDVSYSYGETRALDQVSVEIPQGAVTALVGPSGSGKSTLATLVARFADPDEGRISIGGVDLMDMDEQTLYDTVAFVLQDAQLIRDSLAANIALACPAASLDEIRQAAQAACIDDFIMSLPRGYDTVVGDDTQLSGGQAARIAIARALMKDAPILVLDEATAMADPESEALIQQALTRLSQGRTVLVIAHRLASIRGADQIVVMNRGGIQACGTHEQLLGNAHYQALLAQGEVKENVK